MARACAQTLKNNGFKVATFSRRAKALPWLSFFEPWARGTVRCEHINEPVAINSRHAGHCK